MLKLKNVKNILNKIIIGMLAVILLACSIVPTVVLADDDDDDDDGEGGILFNAIQWLVVGLGDSVIKLMQNSFNGQHDIVAIVEKNDTYEITKNGKRVYEESPANLAANNIIKKKQEITIPMYQMSPEAIFAGKIPAFDINFFSPMKDVKVDNGHYEYTNLKQIFRTQITANTVGYYDITYHSYEGTSEKWKEGLMQSGISGSEVEVTYTSLENYLQAHGWTKTNGTWDHPYRVKQASNSPDGFWEVLDSMWNGIIGAFTFEETMQDRYVWKESEESDVYYVAQSWNWTGLTGNKSGYIVFTSDRTWVTDISTKESSAKILQSSVAHWYYILRTIAIVGLLSVLVYTGIRIVISSTGSDKAKYKEMLKDWLVALCLVFFMHYFMSFIVTMSSSVAESLVTTSDYKSEQQDEIIINVNGLEYKVPANNSEIHEENTTGLKFVGDRLIGDARIKLQTGDKAQRMAYTVIYIVLVIYTFVFSWMYLKRVLYMAFFTMIAPLVALTYPIDKMRDGKAQAFEMWMKEYVFNALLQPFHLILYYIIVGTSIDLTISNPLFGLVAIGFLMPAEKILRRFFGLNQSETAGVLGGAVGGAMLMNGLNALRKGGQSLKGAFGGKGGNDKGKDEKDKGVRTADSGKNTGNLIDGIKDEDGASGNNGEDGENPDDESTNRRLNGDDESDEEGNNNGGNNGEDNDSINETEDGLGEDEEDDGVEGENNSNSDEEKEETHRLKSAATMAGRFVGKGSLKLAGLAAKGTAAATLGTIGVAAGLASDDYRNVLTYGLGAASAGYAMSGALGKKVAKLPSSAYRTATKIRSEYEQGAYSPAEQKRRQNKRADAAFMRDREARRMYQAEFKGNYEQAMKQAIKYREYGVTDNKAIIKAMKLQAEGLGAADSKKRILVAKTAASLQRKDMEEFANRLKANGLGQSADDIANAIRKYNDYE